MITIVRSMLYKVSTQLGVVGSKSHVLPVMLMDGTNWFSAGI